MTTGLRTLGNALWALADGFERGLEKLEEEGEETVFVVLDRPDGTEFMTLVLHQDGSYGMSFPPPYTAEEMDASDDPEEPDEDEEYPDAGR
jgi:hypothetical protein